MITKVTDIRFPRLPKHFRDDPVTIRKKKKKTVNNYCIIRIVPIMVSYHSYHLFLERKHYNIITDTRNRFRTIRLQ